jgi:glycosyltransferase
MDTVQTDAGIVPDMETNQALARVSLLQSAAVYSKAKPRRPAEKPLKISVVTAVYNSSATVGQAIESVAGQTYPNLEHVIIEGASTDRSIAAIRAAAHPRMVLHSGRDQGIYDAFKNGIEHATGDVVGFVHSDDYLAHSRVLSQVAAEFRDPDVEAVFSDLDYVSRGDTSQVVRQWSTGPFAPERLRWGWMPAHPTLYLRRSVYERLGGFDTSYQIAADYDFILRYFSQISKHTAYIPEVLYKMRTGGESNRNLSRITQKSLEDYRAIRSNGVGDGLTLVAKNVSKLGQLLVRFGLSETQDPEAGARPTAPHATPQNSRTGDHTLLKH